MAIYCPRCGRRVSETAGFCPQCGYALRNYTQNGIINREGEPGASDRESDNELTDIFLPGNSPNRSGRGDGRGNTSNDDAYEVILPTGQPGFPYREEQNASHAAHKSDAGRQSAKGYATNNANKSSRSKGGDRIGMPRAAVKPERRELQSGRRRAVIAVVAVIACVAAFFIIREFRKTDLSRYDGLANTQIHKITYGIPGSWNHDNSSNDSKVRYTLKNDGETIAVLDIAYKGEDDLEGDAACNEDHEKAEDIDSLLPENEESYEEVRADHSVFEVALYYLPDKVRGTDKFLKSIIGSFDTDDYENPRAGSLDVEYNGATNAGTTIDENSDFTVTEVYDTGVSKGTKTPDDWTVVGSATLKEGQTSTVTIQTSDDIEQEVQVTCTDLTESQYKKKCRQRIYKSQLANDISGQYTKIHGYVLEDLDDGYYIVSSNGHSGYGDPYKVYSPSNQMKVDDYATCYGESTGTVQYDGKTIMSMTAEYVDRE